jgi:hypothetical protein
MCTRQILKSDPDGSCLCRLPRDRHFTVGLADEIHPPERLSKLETGRTREPKVLSGRMPGAQVTLGDGAT